MKAKKIYFSIFASVLMLFAMSVNVFAGDEVAKIGDTPYTTLELAISNVQSGETIKLVDSISLNVGIVISGDKTFTLDLNGKSISAPVSTLTIKNANVTITGKGTIKETKPYNGAIVLYGSDNVADSNYTKVSIGKDVTLIGWSPLFIRQNAKDTEYKGSNGNTAYGIVADIYGTLDGKEDNTGNSGNGIYINGNISAKENCPIINIYSSAKVTSAGVGIYAAGCGIWNIEGATIEGETAIYQKTGTMNISGSTVLKANGNASAYNYSGDGCNSTGDALVIDNCGYPGSAPTVSITGGYFLSANNKAIGSYSYGDNNEPITGFVSGGYFNDYDNTLLTSDKAYVSSDKDGYLYMVTDKNKLLETAETSLEVINGSVGGKDIGLSSETLKADNTVLTQAGLDVLNSELTMERAITVLKGAGFTYQSGDTIGIEVKVFMYLDVLSYSGDILTVDIQPRYSAYARLNNEKKNAHITTGENLTITQPIEIIIPLPEGFANVGETIYISHKGYVYEATVEKDEATDSLVVCFTNPHGFSKFTITKDNSAVASIYDSKTEKTTNYTTLAQAIKEVKDGETITINKETTEEVIVNKAITFTVTYTYSGGVAGQTPFEIKAGDSLTLTTEEKETGTVTYKFATKEDEPDKKPTTGGGAGGTTTYTVKFETNGGNEIENQKIKSNKTVTEPADPTRDGYTFKGWFEDKELTKEYDFDAKVTKSFTLYAKWEKVEEEYQNPFVDVKPTQWFYNAIKFANQNKIFNGMTSTTFEPDTAMTRAMFVTVLYRLAGEPEVTGESKFADVIRGSYYEKAVIWAEKYGIVKGVSDTEFAPDAEITREQMSAIMHRFAEYMKYDVSVGEDTNILSYEDFNEISEYAIPSMQWAVGTGLMKGQTDSTLNPTSTTTRAEVATLLQRFIEK